MLAYRLVVSVRSTDEGQKPTSNTTLIVAEDTESAIRIAQGWLPRLSSVIASSLTLTDPRGRTIWFSRG